MLEPIGSKRVWAAVRTLYLGSACIFLYTIFLGVMQAAADPDEPIAHGQLLSHFHSGSIGWVTLSVLATSLWAYSGRRQVGSTFERLATLVAYVAIAAAAGYVVAFWVAFGDAGETRVLPVFGIPLMLTIWTTFGLVTSQLKKQDPLTAPHVLLFGALTVVSLGALMGVLLGLSHAFDLDIFPQNEASDAVGSHAGPMDMYIALAFAALAELLLLDGKPTRRSRAAVWQAVLGVLAAAIVLVGLFVGIEPAPGIAFLLFVSAFVIFMVRVGWRAFRQKPTGPEGPAVPVAVLSFIAYVILFTLLVFAYFLAGKDPPHALMVTFQHVTFIGMGTNLLLAIHGRFGLPTSRFGAKWQPLAAWALSLGLAVFIAGELLAERREGAFLMAIGVVATWVIVVGRTLHATHAPTST